MADLTITAANVKPTATSILRSGTAGETLAAGDSVYVDSTDSSKLKKADADTEAPAEGVGVVLVGGSTDDGVVYVAFGEIILGTSVTTKGEIYVVSTNAGKIAPEGDLGTGDYVTILGIATATDRIKLNPLISGATIP